MLGPLTDAELAEVDHAVRRLLELLSDDAVTATAAEEAAS